MSRPHAPPQPAGDFADGQGFQIAMLHGFAVVLGQLVDAMAQRGPAPRELRLQSEGTLAEATVMEVGPADVSFNGVAQWRIRYRYQDHGGRRRHGESGLLVPEEAQQWKAGDRGVARFDAHAPRKSVWLGKT